MRVREGTRFFRGFYHARCVDVFVDEENASGALWAVLVSRFRWYHRNGYLKMVVGFPGTGINLSCKA